MPKDEKKIYSSISREAKKLTLKKGIKFALPLALLLLILMFFQTKLFINIILFLASFTVVVIGFMPYYKISRLENHPFKVHIFENKMILEDAGKQTEIEFHKIVKFEYIEDSLNYGIQVSTRDQSYFLPFFFKEDFEKIKALLNLT